MFWKIIFRLLGKRKNVDVFKPEVLSKEGAAATRNLGAVLSLRGIRENLKSCT